jgi:hypothetical protein
MRATTRASRQRLADKEEAKRFVRRVVVKDFGQVLDEETLESVAEKVLRSLPRWSKDEEDLHVR